MGWYLQSYSRAKRCAGFREGVKAGEVVVRLTGSGILKLRTVWQRFVKAVAHLLSVGLDTCLRFNTVGL